MSMEHKAFVFDAERFAAELRPVLLRALARSDTGELAGFIDAHLPALQHPDLLEPLDAGWRGAVQPADVDAYGDLALTRYYDPGEDIGLGYDWADLDDLLTGLDLPSVVLLGTAVEQDGISFDPGKMGSYVQSAAEVTANLRRLTGTDRPEFAEAAAMLSTAAALGRGLYVTF